ncbi:queuosine precursor transporter [Pseudofulvibacter geojedonensis]|uniref:Probable queuosine precursor transporter n=1 Tax=Pseudofulvibacter geojedonensis TaxID=1123758 RepID=A0ABW3I629_9FLAO
MNSKKQRQAYTIYLYLGALFITSLVVCNLIFQKFFAFKPFPITIFGEELFELSVGLLPYPITFLITDIVSEIYGKQKANNLVKAGLFASVFSLLIVFISQSVNAVSWSPVNNETFNKVFGNATIAVFASMLAYLFAQFIDVHLYHFWKKLTKGKHLWLRNNFSTFSSQLIDTLVILLLLCNADIIAWERFWGLLISGFLFKIMVAILDTPLLYISTYLFRKYFGLEFGEELTLDN